MAVATVVFVKSEVRVRDPHIKKTEVLVGKFEKHQDPVLGAWLEICFQS